MRMRSLPALPLTPRAHFKVGESVTVSGQKTSSGQLTARNVTIQDG